MQGLTNIKKTSGGTKASILLARLAPIIAVVIVLGFFTIVTKGAILRTSTVRIMVGQVFSLLIVAVGAVFVYSHGGIDFSVGAVSGICVMFSLMMIVETKSMLLAFVVSVLAGAVCGAITGGTAIVLNIFPFVASMCMQYICRSILQNVTQKNNFATTADFSLANNTWMRLAVLVLVVAAGVWAFEYSRIGKSLKAIGGNSRAAAFSGINVKLYKWLAYIILGTCVGISGFFTAARSSSLSAASGQGLELNVMIAIALGGLPFTGGSKARVLCAVTGSIIVTIIQNGLILWGVPVEAVQGINGLIFICVIGFTYEKKRGQLI